MIKTYKMLVHELENTYKSPQDKVIRMTENGEIIKLTQGLYETDMKTLPLM